MKFPGKSIQQLNFREVAALARLAEPELVGSTVEQLVIPDRIECIDRYIKGEVVFRLRTRQGERHWGIIMRPQHAIFFVAPGRGPKASPRATQSAFQQQLSKELRSRKIVSVQAIDRERIVRFDFDDRHSLILILIPASPEAVLVERDHRDQKRMVVVASSLLKREAGEGFVFPEPRATPENLVIRDVFERGMQAVSAAIEQEVRVEAFESRWKRAEREWQKRIADLEKRVEQARRAQLGSEKEADFERLGEIAKAHWYDLPEKGVSEWMLSDPETQETVRIAVNPGLDASENLKRLFQQAKRRSRRMHESLEREKLANEDLARLRRARPHDLAAFDFEGLQRFEADLGLAIEAPKNVKALKTRPEVGRSFVSKDGFEFFAGRSLDENLDLTFKVAKGNDVWMHCKDYRGTHVIIPVPSGKTVSLETLLDAAQVAVVMSGGSQCGKTEVDYTFRKFVKRIKGSSQVSYTQNKTLVVSPDSERMKRLFSKGQLGD